MTSYVSYCANDENGFQFPVGKSHLDDLGLLVLVVWFTLSFSSP